MGEVVDEGVGEEGEEERVREEVTGQEVMDDGDDEVREMQIDVVEEVVMNEGRVRERSGMQRVTEKAPCHCSKIVACAANETCCYVWGETLMMEVDPPTCVTCVKCFRHFHQFCVTDKAKANFDEAWKCGCDVQFNDLKK